MCGRGRWQHSMMSGRMHGDVGRELLVPCLHPSLHLSPFSSIFSSYNLSSPVPIRSTLSKKKPIFHFIFPQRSPILGFVLSFLYFPLLLSFFLSVYHLSFYILSCSLHFFPISPGSSVFAYHLSVLAVQAANHWQ